MKLLPISALVVIAACGHRHQEDQDPAVLTQPSAPCTVSPTGVVSCPDGTSFQIPRPEQGVQGPKGEPGDSIMGPMGPTGLPGQDGQDAAAVVEIAVTAKRFYGPSTWENFSKPVKANTLIGVPHELPLTSGNAGTGWAKISFGSVSYCYKGNGTSNSDPGSKWILKHVRSSGDCSSSGGYTIPPVPVLASVGASDTTLVVSIPGGGLSSHLQIATVVSTTIITFEMN